MSGQTNQSTAPSVGIMNSPLANPYASQQSGMPAPKVGLTLDKKASEDYMNKYYASQASNQKFNQYMAAGTQAWNAVMQAVTAGLNYNLQKQYLNLQGKIADHQLDLGMRSIDLELEKVAASERMQKEGNRTGMRIARIQSQTQIAIANIQRKGKTERAKLFTGLNAFKRNNYSTGKPTFQTSILS